VKSAVDILDALGSPFEWDVRQGGLAAIEESHDPLPQATLDSIRRTRLALKGPLTTPVGGGFRSINVRLREEFGLYANVRPVRSMVPGGRFDDIDIVLVRENLGGLYVAFEHYIPIGDDPHAVAISTGVNTREGSRKIIEFAFDYALRNGRKKVTVVHKANVLKLTTGLFRDVCREVAQGYPDVGVDDFHIDAMTVHLVRHADAFDVIVTENMFGDILSDLSGEIAGSLGIAPSLNCSDERAMAQAAHGSAPDIAGQDIANPTAMILSGAMLVDWLGSRHDDPRARAAATLISDAVAAVIEGGTRTVDLGGTASTSEFTDAVVAELGRPGQRTT